MARSHDYIPKADGDLVVFTKNLYDYALANHACWGVLSSEDTLEAPIAAFETALAVFSTTPTTWDGTPTLDTRPETAAAPSGKRAHTITAINLRTQNKEKPEFVSGVAFARRVRNLEDPVSQADNIPSVFQAGTLVECDELADFGVRGYVDVI